MKQIQSRGPLLVLYGSNYGTSQNLAHVIALEGRQKGFYDRILNVGDYNFSNFITEQSHVIFLLSTFGNGGPTYDARDFLKILKRSKADLSTLKYSIFGLGNTSFHNFAMMSNTTDDLLTKLSAKRIFELGKGDANQARTKRDFERWKTQLWPSLLNHYPFKTYPLQELQESRFSFTIEEKKKTFPQFNYENLELFEIERYQAQTQQFLKSHKFDIGNIKGLKKNPKGSQCYYLELKSPDPEDPEIWYKTAQNVNMYPQNNDESVRELAQLLGFDLDLVFEVKMKCKSIKIPFPSPISVYNYLQNFCDLHGKPTKSQVYSLSEFMEDQSKAKWYQNLTVAENFKEYEREITEKRHSILSLVREMKVKMKLDQFINIAHKIPPRSYTVSSSASQQPEQVDLTISILNENGNLGQFSAYLNDIVEKKKDTQLRVSFIDSPFVFPKDQDTPIICVATSAGIGPFRAFWQEKEFKNAKNEMALYFGCRKREDDFIYGEEITKRAENNIINKLELAFSQDQDEKVYVQHLIEKDMDYIADQWLNKKGKIYICGSQQMTDAVLKVLGEIMSRHMHIAIHDTQRKIYDMMDKQQILTEIQI